ncbi:RnfH family protein [Guyparkeria hydrothermalis]|uniref:RnfH family protein n=1 Tax=Guyparkeria hydrothermalis TaxID=923 RepID=UPI00201FBCE2|nr:RnfH family protein [Guyparkeria hydrothermalis]MCL7743362.1 RnfH family protein [Guyparkeria hydrothermalis]
MKVEVAYARPDVQVILEVDVPEGATAEEAIRASGILERFPEIDLTKQKVGIFSKVAPLSKDLREWDRVEIYRALIADPKAARRQRAQKDKQDDRKAAAKSGAKGKDKPPADSADAPTADTKKPAE